MSDYQLIYSNLLAKFDIHNVWNSISNIAQNVWNNSNIASLITLCYNSHQINVNQFIIKKMYIVLWSRRALCVMVFYMLAFPTEITLSVMSFDVRTTLLVQAACPLDNSTDTQAVSVYKHYNTSMTSPYLLLVTGSLRSNRSRAKCTAKVGMSYRLYNSFY